MATKKETTKNLPAKRPGVSVKKGTVQETGVVIQNITIRPVQRTLLDIERWRNYHKAAESIAGTRVALYDLYSDVLLDGFLKRLIAKRVLGVTKHKLKVVDASGKEVEGAENILKLREFRKLRQRIQLQKAWGIAVIELINDNGRFRIFDAPKKHIRPKEGVVVYEQLGVEGIPYREAPFCNTVVEIGDYDDLGYLLEACAYVIYKRGDIADWANFAQIFGMPFREARYDGYNDGVRAQLEAALEKAGSAAYAVLPKEAELTFHEAKNVSGSTDLYDKLRKAMNEELSVLVLGATETTTSSSSSGYAQSETHHKTVDELAQDDKEDELAVLNEQVYPVLVHLGFLPEGGTFAYDEPVDIDVAKAKVDIATKLRNAGVPVSDDYFYDISGIPKPDNYDEIKGEMNAAKEKENEAKANFKPGQRLSVEEIVEQTLKRFFA